MARFSVNAPDGLQLPTDVVTYGADIPREDTLKLLGPVEGKRVLDLGCGGGHNAVALAKAGAKVIAVDPSAAQISEARAASEREGVKLELHHAPLAELAFIRADTIDVAVSAFGLATVQDIDRVFRQVDRVLRPEHNFVLSLPHPAFALIDPGDPDRRVQRSYWDPTPVDALGGDEPPDFPRTVNAVFTSLGRANFRVDTVLEPQPLSGGRRGAHWAEVMQFVPATLIIRARKQGI